MRTALVEAKIGLFVEIVDSSPGQSDGVVAPVGDSVETGPEEYAVAVDFAERTVVHLVEKPPALALDSDPAFERMPETHWRELNREVVHVVEHSRETIGPVVEFCPVGNASRSWRERLKAHSLRSKGGSSWACC